MSDKPAVPAPAQPVQVQIEIDAATANGVFVNFAMVNHTDSEFTLDLLYLHPEAPKATVRARAILTPKHMKRLLSAMQENLGRYESMFGVVDAGPGPHFPRPGAN
jgi:alkyl hydroperoxide reductase subunit AhpC